MKEYVGEVNNTTNSAVVNYNSIIKRKALSLVFMRAFDVLASFFGLIILIAPFLVTAIIIALTSKGGVFFKQVRVGRNGKNFKIIKFRTMVSNAETQGLQLSTKNDSRITKIGSILRKTKIDELPQLFNVFIGQMSLVGPRPEVPKYVALYDEQQRNVLLVRPGITEEASIVFRDENKLLANANDAEETYVNEIMPIKLKYNLEYITKMSLFYNIKLIFKTICTIL